MVRTREILMSLGNPERHAIKSITESRLDYSLECLLECLENESGVS